MVSRFSNTILFVILSANLFCQPIDEKDFIHYGLNNGLSDNYVSGIVQDSSGYLWISTRRGLNRFDGKIFKQFLRDDKYNAIPDNSIFSIRLLNDGRLAIASDDGAQIISTKTLRQTNLLVADDDQLRYWNNACISVLNDADGNYGVSTKTGFYIFSSAGQLKKRFDKYSRKDIGEWMLFGDDVYSLPDGNIFQLNADGSLMYDRQKDQITDATIKFPALKDLVNEKNNSLFFPISKTEIVHLNVNTNSFDLIDIYKGRVAAFPSCVDFFKNIGWMTAFIKINDTTWAVTCRTKGFFLITMDPIKKTFSCSPKRYFADKLCTAIFRDRDNKLWIGTIEGLYKQSSLPKIVETFRLQVEKLEGAAVSALYLSNDKIFVGTDKNKVLILDKTSKKLIGSVRLHIDPELSNYIRAFYPFTADTLWIATSSGLAWLHMQDFSSGQIEIDKTKDSRSIYLLFADKKRNVWIPVYKTNTIYYYDRNARTFTTIDSKSYPIFKTNVTSVAEDKEGNIWIAGDAIVRWNSKTKKIDTLIERLGTQQNSKRGYGVMSDSKGDIWTVVPDDGLAKLTGNGMHLRLKNLTQERSSFISPALLNDKIFVFTAKGSGYFDIASSKSIAFAFHDGMPPGPASTYFFVSDASDGSVWFAIKNVLCKIPSHPAMDYLKPPVLTITALSILNDTILNYPSKKVKLNYRQGDVNIFYSAINYADPENMLFAFRIKNKKDSTWIEAGDRQNILLTNISPGSYKIELKVSAFDNKWAEQIKELEIEIEPPFWQTPLFFISIALSLALIAYSLYRYRIRQIKQKANVDKLLAQTEMKALHSQMNPHFIFNCLNSIREMILNNENEQASVYLSKFARLIRITLNHSAKTFVSLEDTIDYLRRYLEMEQIRKSNFTYAITVDDDLHRNEILLPPMLIQPFIENAIWHGSSPAKEMKLNIRFTRKKNELICIVEDDGIGIETSLNNKEAKLNYQSVGISNIKHRIQVLNEKYDLQSTVDIKDKSGLHLNGDTGTIVTLQLTIKSKEALL